jgi:diguanylate cyclase (GGDEF)-like protein
MIVLIASKQEWTSRTFESILAPKGWVVLKSYTAGRALERARRDQPDVIIVDTQLPDETGHELCRRMREEQVVTASTPILLTLHEAPTRRDRLAALRVGAWDCLGPPYDADELVALLDVLVSAKLDGDRTRAEGLVDATTGLYNVRGVTRRAREMASQAARHHAALSCVLLAPDLSLSESGEVAPDSEPVVQQVAEALKAAGRRSDAIGRLSPDAFAVIAPDTNAPQARQLALRLADAISTSLQAAPPHAPAVRLHAGYHSVPDFHEASLDPVDLMLRATAALRKARSDPAGVWLWGFDEVSTPAG